MRRAASSPRFAPDEPFRRCSTGWSSKRTDNRSRSNRWRAFRPRTRGRCLITAWDKGVVPEIRKAVEKSDLGLTPNVDGSAIRLAIPPLNEERRKDLAKLVKKKAEDGRVAVRNVRHRAHDELKAQLKAHEITEDDNKRMQESLQRLTDKYVKEIDELVAAKEKEIMEV